jgi:uncharacterized protein (TIGR03118 family)
MLQITRFSSLLGLAAFGCASLLVASGCSSSNPTPVTPTSYSTTVLAADTVGFGTTTIDPTLKNPWGVTNAPSAPLFVANNHSRTIGDYDLTSGALKKSYTIPDTLGGPTGIVYNSDFANSFVVTGNGQSNYIFATEAGSLGALSVNNDLAIAYQARSGTASYKGLAIGSNNNNSMLYAANFKNSSLDVFDKNFARVAQSTDNLTGSDKLPTDFAPFNATVLNGTLYVTYAKQGSDGDDQPGAGNGYIDIFNMDGSFNKRFASQGALNSPWGMAIAPDNFGDSKGKLLVGNFGDGTISIFNPSDGKYIGQLKNASGSTVVIDGLWGLYVSNGVLYYTAGPSHEAHGVLGTITAK